MAQSIVKNSIDNNYKKLDDSLLDMANKLNIKKRFMIDCDVDENEFIYTYIMKGILCSSNCEVRDYVWDKINAKLQEDCNIPAYRKPERIFDKDVEDCVKKIEW